jgi:hypothetical protein
MNANKKIIDTKKKFVKEDKYISVTDELEYKVNKSANAFMAAVEISEAMQEMKDSKALRAMLDVIELLLGSDARTYCENELSIEEVQFVFEDAFAAASGQDTSEAITEEPRFRE